MRPSTLEIGLRAALGFGISLWLGVAFGPKLLAALLPLHTAVLEMLNGNYRIELSLTSAGADLVMYLRATVLRTTTITGGGAAVMLSPGTVLMNSTATGLLLQPAVMLGGLVIAWPASNPRDFLVRIGVGLAALGFCVLLAIPLYLCLCLLQLPILAFVPGEITVPMLIVKLMLNGGALIVGALMGAAVIVTATRFTHRAGVGVTPETPPSGALGVGSP
jgi:hypothetical protein